MRPHLNQQMLGILDWRYGSSARESTKPWVQKLGMIQEV
jgi:hypothetical protein